MTDILNSCPRCGMQHGQCVHVSDGSITLADHPVESVDLVSIEGRRLQVSPADVVGGVVYGCLGKIEPSEGQS